MFSIYQNMDKSVIRDISMFGIIVVGGDVMSINRLLMRAGIQNTMNDNAQKLTPISLNYVL